MLFMEHLMSELIFTFLLILNTLTTMPLPVLLILLKNLVLLGALELSFISLPSLKKLEITLFQTHIWVFRILALKVKTFVWQPLETTHL